LSKITIQQTILALKNILLFTIVMTVITGCVPMMMHGAMKNPMTLSIPEIEQSVIVGQDIDEAIAAVVQDLSLKNLNVSSIAVWRIKSHTADLDVEMIRQKLVAQLVNSDRFMVLSRERLEEVLKEQGLSLSGVIDEKSAVEIGQLIGVEGFIDGYVSIVDDQIIFSLSLVETKSGLIVWATTAQWGVGR